MLNSEKIRRTAEHASEGHPDKFCDQVADAILDKALELAGDDESRRRVRTAVECFAKDRLLIVSGEVGFSEKIRDRFVKLLSPQKIIDGFQLRNPTGRFGEAEPEKWSYLQSAAYGHYGRDLFPWEQPGFFKGD